jgi:signal transduction histidine kinase
VVSNDIYDKEKQRNIVLAQVARGSRLIATMAGILGGKHQRKIKPCSLESLVRDCLYIFEASIDKVVYDFCGLPSIKGDEDDLKILFINLIKNSVEARRNNEELQLQVKSWLESGNIYVSIGDNGTGMTDDQLSNLWELGFSTKELGSGIGMQAIKRIADEHNAKIDVSSQLAIGSKFTLCFIAAQTVELPIGNGTADSKEEIRRSRT